MRGKTNPFPSFEYALLGLLYGGRAHGYELHKLITAPDGLGLIWGVKISNLYAQLSKLEKAGLIKGELQPGEDRPARTEFHLTDPGMLEFSNWLTLSVRHPRELRQEFMLRYFFLARYSPAKLEETCRQQLADCQQWLLNLQENQHNLIQKTFSYAIMEFRASQIKSMVEWLEWLIINPPII